MSSGIPLDIKQALESWDCYLNNADADGYYDDPGFTILHTWYDALYEKTLLDELSILVKDYSHSLLLHILQGDVSKLHLRYRHYLNDTIQTVIIDALKQTIFDLETQYNTTNVSRWLTPVDMVDFSELGNLQTPLMPYMNRGTYNQVIELPRWNTKPLASPRGESVLPPGQSGFVSAQGVPSPYAYNQLLLYTSWMFKDMHICADDLLPK
jgi:penicillin amidase